MKQAKAKANKPKRQPNRLAVKGSGAYSIREITDKVLKMIPKGTFANAGGALGGAFGGPAGQLLGRAAGQSLSMATGYGDYILNDIVHKGQSSIQQMDPNAPRTIVHSEYITDVLAPGNANFNVTSTFAVNPGDGKVFPWLSVIAQRFAKYRFRQLIFEFRSSSSDFATNSALGTVILAPNYNPLMSAPTTKAVMEAWSGAVSAKPSNGMYAGIECEKRSNPVKWVRNATVNTQSQLTELCDFFVAISGSPAALNTALGEIWVHYTVDLMEPLLPSDVIQAGTSVLLGGTMSTTFAAAGFSGKANTTLNWTSDVSPGVLSQCFASTIIPNNYLFWVDQGATNSGRIAFGRVGKYLIQFGFSSTVAFGATGNPAYNTVFSDGVSTYTRTWNDNGNLLATTNPVYQCSWIVDIKTAGCILTTTFNSAAWTTGTNFQSSTPCYITIIS